MTSFKQIKANRRNASKSTGPITEAGKQRSRRNAIRHGLTAETVIAPFEDAEDYHLFEAAVTVDFNPETAVERELVLRLASLLWRLRRASSIETGIFKTPTGMGAEDGQAAETERDIPQQSSPPMFNGPACHRAQLAECSEPDCIETVPRIETDTQSHLATRFLHLTAADKSAFERLSRYETALWRQVCQTAFMLDVLRRQAWI